MATREVGIIISVKNRATKEIVDLGRVARGTATVLKNIGKAGTTALSIVSNAANAVNQAMEIGRKAMETWNMVVTESINKAVEFRSKSDPMVKFWKNLQSEAELTRARFGDALLPVIRGFVEAMDQATGKTSEFVAKNRELITLRVADWAIRIGQALVTGVAGAAKIVGNSFEAIKFAASSVEQAVAAMSVGAIGWIDKFLGKMRTVASAFGADGLVKKIDETRASLDLLSETFEETGVAAAATVTKSGKAIVAWNRQVRRMAKRTRYVLRNVNRNVKNLNETMQTGFKQTAEEAAQTEFVINRLLNRRLKAIDMELAAKEAQTQKLVELDEERRASAKAVAETIGNTISESMIDVMMGAQTMEEAVSSAMQTIVRSILTQLSATIVAKAADAAVGAASAVAPTPVVGPGLAIAAAGSVFAALAGYSIYATQKMNQGGVVPGPRVNRDVVPAMLTPGERVLTVQQNREYEQGGASRGTVSINFAPTIQTLEVSNEVQQRRMLVRLAGELEQLINDGVVLRSVGAAAAR